MADMFRRDKKQQRTRLGPRVSGIIQQYKEEVTSLARRHYADFSL